MLDDGEPRQPRGDRAEYAVGHTRLNCARPFGSGIGLRHEASGRVSIAGTSLFATATAAPAATRLAERRRRAGAASPTDRVLALQRAAGNHTVARLLQRKHVLSADVPGKLAGLIERYPRLAIGESNLQETHDAFWEECVKQSLAEVIAPALEAIAPDLADKALPFRVTLRAAGPRGVNISITELENPHPRSVVQEVSEQDGALAVKLVSVYAPGKGKTIFKDGLLPVFAKLGVRRLTLEASSAGGSRDGMYVWARYGFVPLPDEWNRMRELGREAIQKGRATSLGRTGEFAHTDLALPPAIGQRVDAILESTDPKALRNLVVLSWKHRDDPQVKALLDAMLSSPWHGTLDLANAEDAGWLDTYANSGKDPSAATFEDFLTANLDTPRAQRQDDGCCIIL